MGDVNLNNLNLNLGLSTVVEASLPRQVGTVPYLCLHDSVINLVCCSSAIDLLYHSSVFNLVHHSNRTL